MSSLTCGGHGAPDVNATRWAGMGAPRSAVLSRSSRMSMVGTHCEWVTPCARIAARAAAALKRSMHTTVPPAASVMSWKVNGEAW